jgi:hypothetical protein
VASIEPDIPPSLPKSGPPGIQNLEMVLPILKGGAATHPPARKTE